MRVAFLSTIYPFRGGIAQFNGNLYDAFSKEDEVKAFTFTCQYPSFLFPGKTQYVSEGDGDLKIDSEAVLSSVNPFTWGSTARKIAAWKPDFVVLGYWMSFLAPCLGIVAKKLRRKGIKVVTVVHNMIPHEPKFFDKPLAKWFLGKNDGCVAMCRAVESDILSLKKDIPLMRRPHPLYNHFAQKMPKEAAAEALGLAKDKKTILFFGLIRDYKGLDILIDAFKQLDDSHQLLIAGECYGSFEKYAAQIAASGCADRIKVMEHFITNEEVPVLFSAADICVLPYRSATQSGITAVSVNFDVPLVATAVGGLPESIEETGIGIIAKDITPEAIAETIKDMFSEGTGKYVEAIASVKRTQTWPAFAECLTSFVSQLPDCR